MRGGFDPVKDACPKCNGRGLVPTRPGQAPCMTCSACGTSGLNSAARKRRADEHHAKAVEKWKKEKERVELERMAVDQFQVRTNLDGVLKEILDDYIRWEEIRVSSREPRRHRKSKKK